MALFGLVLSGLTIRLVVKWGVEDNKDIYTSMRGIPVLYAVVCIVHLTMYNATAWRGA